MSLRLRGGGVLLLLACFTLFTAGCAGRSVQLFTHPNPKVPHLRGRTIAVFPPLSLGAERGPAIVAGDTLEAVFSDDLAGIRFVPPTRVVARTSASEADLAALAEQMAGHLPIDVAPKRQKTVLFGGDRVGDTRLPGPLRVTLQRDPYPRRQLSPAVLPRAWFAGLDADLVLVTVCFSTYRQVSRTAALLGVLPIAWERRLVADGPRALFALYEVETGARVWDIIVGVGEPARIDTGDGARTTILDPRRMPVVGLAYLLSGEIVGPLERAIPPARHD